MQTSFFLASSIIEKEKRKTKGIQILFLKYHSKSPNPTLTSNVFNFRDHYKMGIAKMNTIPGCAKHQQYALCYRLLVCLVANKVIVLIQHFNKF